MPTSWASLMMALAFLLVLVDWELAGVFVGIGAVLVEAGFTTVAAAVPTPDE